MHPQFVCPASPRLQMCRFTDGLVVVVSPAQRTESNRQCRARSLQERIVRRRLAVASRCSSHDEALVRLWCVHLGAPGTRVPCFAGARLYRAFGVCGYSRALRWGCDRIMDTWSVCVAARTMDAIPLMWDERRLVFAACLCDYRPCEPEAHHASAVPRGRAARARVVPTVYVVGEW